MQETSPSPESNTAKQPGLLARIAWRFFQAGVAFLLCILAIAAMLNSSMEATIDAQINEEVRLSMASLDIKSLTVSPIEYRLQAIARLRQAYGLEKPRLQRILERTWDILNLDLGFAATGRRGENSVGKRVLGALGNSLILLGISTLIAVLAGIALGTGMARRPGGRLDRNSSLAAMVFFGTPTWWVASFVLWIFVYETRLFPFGRLSSVPPPVGLIPQFLDRCSYLVLPVLSIAFIRTWGFAYIVRSIVLGPLQEDYVMAARGRGLPEGLIVRRHGLRTALPGIVTTGLQYIMASLGGDIVVEKIFAYPGIGLLFWESIVANNVVVAASSLAILTAMTCLGYALLDSLYGFLDPRIGHPAGRHRRA
jgi:peptide/nickel transport system permease protein